MSIRIPLKQDLNSAAFKPTMLGAGDRAVNDLKFALTNYVKALVVHTRLKSELLADLSPDTTSAAKQVRAQLEESQPWLKSLPEMPIEMLLLLHELDVQGFRMIPRLESGTHYDGSGDFELRVEIKHGRRPAEELHLHYKHQNVIAPAARLATYGKDLVKIMSALDANGFARGFGASQTKSGKKEVSELFVSGIKV